MVFFAEKSPYIRYDHIRCVYTVLANPSCVRCFEREPSCMHVRLPFFAVHCTVCMRLFASVNHPFIHFLIKSVVSDVISMLKL